MQCSNIIIECCPTFYLIFDFDIIRPHTYSLADFRFDMLKVHFNDGKQPTGDDI